ncbi:MAG: 2-phosphosulfolactate phosphatase [Clostridia bacterium]
MKIEKKYLLKGAKEATGLTVIIDVFRAFSTACYLYDCGVKTIIPTDSINFAYKYRDENENVILVGERKGEMINKFDYGNSPCRLKNLNLEGKIAVLSTSSGTKGLVNANNADQIISGSFVNAKAIARYIKDESPEVVSLVAMGTGGGIERAEEDDLLADYIECLLLGRDFDLDLVKHTLRFGSGKRFFDPSQTHSPIGDFNSCLEFNKYDFILKYEGIYLNKYEI